MTTNPIITRTLHQATEIIEDTGKRALILKLITTVFNENIKKIGLETVSDNAIEIQLQFTASYQRNSITIPSEVSFKLNKAGTMWFDQSCKAPYERVLADVTIAADCWYEIEPKNNAFRYVCAYTAGFFGCQVAGGTPRVLGDVPATTFLNHVKSPEN